MRYPSIVTRSPRLPGFGRCLLGVVLCAGLALPGRAAEEETSGQEDLDRATLVKLSAKSLGDLETAIDLCESALKKGVDAGNESYAKELLTATLYEHASRLSRLIFDQRPVDPRWPRARQLALRDLERALEVDPEMGSAQLLVARLQALPGGDNELALQAVEAAVRLLQDDKEQLSTAILVRGSLSKDPEAMMADFDRALELNPRNGDALRTRAALHLARGENEQALQDFEALLALNPDDLTAHQAVAQALRNLKQFDKALEHLDRVIASEPRSAIPFVIRAQILEETGKLPEAIESLNQAIEAQPNDLAALLFRGRLYVMRDEFEPARTDVDRVLRLQPRLPQAVLLRSLISAAEQKFAEAIGDLRPLVRRNPENLELKLQLATYFEADQRLTRAIELYSEVLDKDPDQWLALRRRGDAYLGQGKQQEAAQDYEAAMKLQPEDSGILNNLAWLLATSTEDPLRDGKRALELAQKACELTEYKQAHILSTLAACHAELGDFDEAIQWSSKAVDLDPDEEQLSKELQSYREQKPWRERVQIEENTEPLPPLFKEEDLPDDLPEDQPSKDQDPKDAPEDAPADLKETLDKFDADGPHSRR